MLNTKSFLAVDFGAGNLKLADFEINEAGGLLLKNFSIKPLGSEGAQETTREAAILKALQEALAEMGTKSQNVNVCAPGFHVFSKFVKLPPVEGGKVTQIIQYEAQQNVPFPLSEVVWDYQILGTAPSGELEVLLVAIKSEVVEGLFRVAEKSKLRLQLCDASPAALCNAFRFNYGDIEECAMLLDIGAKTSNLLFFENGKVFARSINLGANAITQDFANEAKLKFEVAEQIKIAEGFVSLGGAYEEPENENQAKISKIARQFMTKLHIQVNQTMQFYRGQQGGSMPQKLFLAGGASIMPYAAQFFAEKLSNDKVTIQPEYFNPFRNVQIDPAVNLEDLARTAHSFGEVVGVALRNLANCPVELNLMPESTLRWRSFNEKKPYFIATVFSLVLVAFSIGFLFQKLAKAKEDEAVSLNQQMQPAQVNAQKMKQANAALLDASNQVSQITAWMDDQYYWINTLAEMRQVLMRSEEEVRKKLAERQPDIQAGIWIDQMTIVGVTIPVAIPAAIPGAAIPAAAVESTDAAAALRALGALNPGGAAAAPSTPSAPSAPSTTVGAAPAAGKQEPISALNLVLRSVNLTAFTGDPAANNEIAYAVEGEFKKATGLFDPKTTQLAGNLNTAGGENAAGTFTFGLSATLAKPLNLVNPQK
jgi:type IV pilus assembly protein PilM